MILRGANMGPAKVCSSEKQSGINYRGVPLQYWCMTALGLFAGEGINDTVSAAQIGDGNPGPGFFKMPMI